MHYVAHMRDIKNVYQILVGGPSEKTSVAGYRIAWEDMIKVTFKKHDVKEVDWIQLAQNKVQ